MLWPNLLKFLDAPIAPAANQIYKNMIAYENNHIVSKTIKKSLNGMSHRLFWFYLDQRI